MLCASLRVHNAHQQQIAFEQPLRLLLQSAAASLSLQGDCCCTHVHTSDSFTATAVHPTASCCGSTGGDASRAYSLVLSYFPAGHASLIQIRTTVLVKKEIVLRCSLTFFILAFFVLPCDTSTIPATSNAQSHRVLT